MADIEVPDPAIDCEALSGAAVPEVETSRRGSVRDTIAGIDAELARHEPSAPAALSDVEG